MTINFATNEVDVTLFGDNIQLDGLGEKIGQTYFVKRFRDALSINEYVVQLNIQKDREHYVFEVSENATLSMIDDHIILPDYKTMTLLSVSHALAQSAKLGRFEELAERTIKDNELHEMLAAEQNHKHSSFLEWIIIILIAVEIVLFFVH